MSGKVTGLLIDIGDLGLAVFSILGCAAITVLAAVQNGKDYTWLAGVIFASTLLALNWGVVLSLLPWFFIGHRMTP
jgi:hypothetical protein